MIKFVANNNYFLLTKLSPFFTLKSLYLQMSFDIINLLNITTCERINKKKAINISEAMQSI